MVSALEFYAGPDRSEEVYAAARSEAAAPGSQPVMIFRPGAGHERAASYFDTCPARAIAPPSFK